MAQGARERSAHTMHLAIYLEDEPPAPALPIFLYVSLLFCHWRAARSYIYENTTSRKLVPPGEILKGRRSGIDGFQHPLFHRSARNNIHPVCVVRPGAAAAPCILYGINF